MFTKGQKVIITGVMYGDERRDVPADYHSTARADDYHIVYVGELRMTVHISELYDAQDFWDIKNKDSTEPAYVNGMTIGEAVRKRRGWDNE